VDATKELIGQREAARKYGLSPATIRRRIKDGRLPVFVRDIDDQRKLVRSRDLEALMRPHPLNSTEKAAGVAA